MNTPSVSYKQHVLGYEFSPLHGVPTEQVEVFSDEAKKAFKFLNIEI